MRLRTLDKIFIISRILGKIYLVVGYGNIAFGNSLYFIVVLIVLGKFAENNPHDIPGNIFFVAV